MLGLDSGYDGELDLARCLHLPVLLPGIILDGAMEEHLVAVEVYVDCPTFSISLDFWFYWLVHEKETLDSNLGFHN